MIDECPDPCTVVQTPATMCAEVTKGVTGLLQELRETGEAKIALNVSKRAVIAEALESLSSPQELCFYIV